MSVDALAGTERARFAEHASAVPFASPPADHHGTIELRHLRYFIGVAEALHFGRAAARLYISQPGLSQAIARLEEQLDVKLFLRTRQNVDLTTAGTELLRCARRLLADHDETLHRVRSVGRGHAGSIRLGIALLAEPTVAPALVAFDDEHEQIVLERSFMTSERLLEQLNDGRLHAAVVHQVPALASMRTIEWEPLRLGRLAVVTSRSSQLVKRDTVRLSELRDETFLVNPRSVAPGAFEGLQLMCRQYGGFAPNVLESTAASTVAIDTDGRPIRDGVSIAIVAEPTARAIDRADLSVTAVEPPPLYIVALAWRAGEQAAPIARFLEYIRDYRDRYAWTSNPAAQ